MSLNDSHQQSGPNAARPIFHLAFPIKDVPSTVQFYRDHLGLPVRLIEKSRCIIDFLGHQAVAHVSEAHVPQTVTMYPRHFGVIFSDEADYDRLLENARKHNLEFFQEPFVRFGASRRAHRTFFLKDPSNNLLEFKWYRNAEFIFQPAE